MCGDINPNPGPKSSRTCTECSRIVARHDGAKSVITALSGQVLNAVAYNENNISNWN